jgi:transposase-like protein
MDQIQEGGDVKKEKRKLTPYNIYVKKHFALLKKEFPDNTAPQIMKMIGAEWQKNK